MSLLGFFLSCTVHAFFFLFLSVYTWRLWGVGRSDNLEDLDWPGLGSFGE